MDANNLVSIYKQYFKENPNVIFDFGAHDLRDSLILAESFQNAKIYSFEANPDYYQHCIDNNRYPERISVGRQAISNKNEMTKFHLTKGNIGASSMLKPIDWVPWTSDKTTVEITVEAIRLDTWMNSNGIPVVDMIWMDVQGAELICLDGLGEKINDVKVIQTEVGILPYYEGHTLYPEINMFLEDKGFKQVFRQNDWSHEDNVAYINTKFI